MKFDVDRVGMKFVWTIAGDCRSKLDGLKENNEGNVIAYR
jgi:hypothetical protein